MSEPRTENVFRDRLAREVERLCGQRGWSQAELVRQLGSYRSQATRLLAGEVPTELGTLEKLAHIFGVPTHEFVWRLLRVRRGEPDRSPQGHGRWKGEPYFEEVRSEGVGREEFAQGEDLIYQRIFASVLGGLESADARRLFDAVCRLIQGGEAEALRTLADAAEGVTRRRGMGDSMIGVPLGSLSAARLP